MGIEPTFSAWEADVLPLNYTRRKSPAEKPVRIDIACLKSPAPWNTPPSEFLTKLISSKSTHSPIRRPVPLLEINSYAFILMCQTSDD